MSMHDHLHNESPTLKRSFLTTRLGWIFMGFAVAGGVLLFTEHRAHVLGLLIWLPLLACPLMHLFMHHGHGGQDHASEERKTP